MFTKKSTEASRVLEFPPFTIDLDRHTLRTGDDLRVLRRQSFEVFKVLIDSQGVTVPSEDVIKAVWKVPPSRPDASLTQCIKDIRRALGDEFEWMVRTVPGTGYAFVPKLTERAPDARDLPERSVPEESVPGQIEQPAIAVIGSCAAPQAALEHEQMPGPVQAATASKPRRAAPRPSVLVGLLLAAMALFLGFRALLGPNIANTAPAASLKMLAMPSVIVLPTSVGADAPQTLTQTLANEIATEMRRTPRGYDLLIKTPIAQPPPDASASAYAQQFGVRYMVVSSLREQENTRQLTVQLVEAATGRQIWGAPFIQPAGGLAEQSMLAARIARALVVQIRAVENNLPLPEQVEAGHFVLQGRALLESERGAEINGRSMALFDKALALDPNHAQALLGFARTRVDAVALGWVSEQARHGYLRDAESAVDRVIAIDKAMTGAHLLRGVIARTKGNFDAALASLEHARELNPNYPFTHAEIGLTKALAGQPHESIGHIEHALRLSPTDPTASFWCYWAGMAAAHVGDFKASLDWLLRSKQLNPQSFGYRPWLAIAYSQLGEQDRARQLVKEHVAAAPTFSVANWQRLHGRNNPPLIARLDRFAAILRELSAP